MEKETILFLSLFGIAVAVLVALAFLTGGKAWREMEVEADEKKTNNNDTWKIKK